VGIYKLKNRTGRGGRKARFSRKKIIENDEVFFEKPRLFT
jgi:hypothetical protein